MGMWCLGFWTRIRSITQSPFELPAPIGRAAEGRLTLWPHIHGTDGFYIAKLRRDL